MAERFLGSIRRISLTTWLATNKNGYSAFFDSDGVARRWFLQGTAEKSYGLAGIRFEVGANGITTVRKTVADVTPPPFSFLDFGARLDGYWDPAISECRVSPVGAICADGDEVGYIQDLSGNGHHLYSRVYGAFPGPIWKATSPMGGPALLFDGTPDMMLTAPDITPRAVFAIATNGHFGCLFADYSGLVGMDSASSDAIMFTGTASDNFWIHPPDRYLYDLITDTISPPYFNPTMEPVAVYGADARWPAFAGNMNLGMDRAQVGLNRMWDGYVGAVAVLNGEATPTEERAGMDYLVSTYGPRPTSAGQVIFVGDSITAGVAAFSREARLPAVVVATTTRPTMAAINLGIGHLTTAAALARISNVTRRTRGGARNIVVVQLCVNDNLTGVSAATSLANLALIYSAIHAAGFTVVVCSPSDFAGADETQRQLLRFGLTVGVHGDVVADVSSSLYVGVPGSYLDTTIFVDGIHPTELGFEKWAIPITAAVNTLL